MTTPKKQVFNNDRLNTRRTYNQWAANETLEDFALRYTAKRARQWSRYRIANTALGTVSFLALEAIGGAIMIQYGFTHAVSAILVVCLLFFLTAIPICYYAARYNVDIDLLTRGAGFGYIGSTISSLIYASFTFIFFAIEASIMSMAITLLIDIPLSLAYVISAVVVIPLATYGITLISRFQVWTQPLWLALQIAPIIAIGFHYQDALGDWQHYKGASQQTEGFDLLLFGAAAAVIFPLIAQVGEQVDFLRFLPDKQEKPLRWWSAMMIAGPGWAGFGVIKLLIGTFLAMLALNAGLGTTLAADPSHMYALAFNVITNNPDVAIVIAGVFVIISQLKINVANAYAGSLAWSNFFSRLTHSHPGRVVWLIFNVLIALLLMELGIYQAFESILNAYACVVVAWIGTLVADLSINKPLGLSPKTIEFKRGHLYDINPVGMVSMLSASALGLAAHFGWFGETAKALSPFIALFLPFLVAPAIAWLTKGKYYLARPPSHIHSQTVMECCMCGNDFDAEDMSHCPAYQGDICSLCCSLDSLCADACRPNADLHSQIANASRRLFRVDLTQQFNKLSAQFTAIFIAVNALVGGLLLLIYHQFTLTYNGPSSTISQVLMQTFFLLMIIIGVLVWLYILANHSKNLALDEARQQTERLSKEVAAHQQTYDELQRQKESAEAANQAKSRYLSGVSHELRTPLNTIFGYAQLLETDQQLASNQQEKAAIIRRSGEHLAGVIEGLLEISKMEAGRLELHTDTISLPMLLSQIVDMFRIQARDKGIEFDYQASPMPEYVRADEKRLRQILINVLSNAIKFTHRGGTVSFHVTYRNQIVRFIVEDTGVGISPVDQKRIFEPFERIRDKHTQDVVGTGLGLSITKLLTDIMGGNIELQSERNRGAKFTLSFMLPSVEQSHLPDKPRRLINGYRGQQQTILVTDDDPSHRGLIRDLMMPLGFQVFEAHNASACLQFIDDDGTQIDLFILDISMPDINGLTLAAKLRERKIQAPILIASANALEAYHEDMKGTVFNDYISKPIRTESLLTKVGLLLALQWTTKSDDADVDATSKNDKERVSDLIDGNSDSGRLPETTILEGIRSAASIGYLNGVTNLVNQLDNRQYPVFIDQITPLIHQCALEAIVALIDGHTQNA
ncbi:Aerobic respiration control sensor protein ArcB [BD1-7 clade bacterium]|uniref:histidine kinase n=1 Tax=BD1-7 clade bacterium TaxID=2029982 RepID=A0A5S9QV62_9GAMM|nr:Aerobic respiration control sensor protein ArcB [BD1-7 clade bacterium]